MRTFYMGVQRDILLEVVFLVKCTARKFPSGSGIAARTKWAGWRLPQQCRGLVCVIRVETLGSNPKAGPLYDQVWEGERMLGKRDFSNPTVNNSMEQYACDRDPDYAEVVVGGPRMRVSRMSTRAFSGVTNAACCHNDMALIPARFQTDVRVRQRCGRGWQAALSIEMCGEQ